MIHLMACRNPCRIYIHLAFTYSVGPSSVVWSEFGPAPLFSTNESAWSVMGRALSLMCEVGLKRVTLLCFIIGFKYNHLSHSSHRMYTKFENSSEIDPLVRLLIAEAASTWSVYRIPHWNCSTYTCLIGECTYKWTLSMGEMNYPTLTSAPLIHLA